jgi:Flp pilus assembly protein TadG
MESHSRRVTLPIRQAGRARPGQSLVEFMLALPVFVLLLFAVIDGARGMYAYVALSNAASLGAHTAAETVSQNSAFGQPSQTTYNSFLSSVVASVRGQLGIVKVDLSTTATADTSGSNTIDVHNSSITITGHGSDGSQYLYNGTTSKYDETSVQCTMTATFQPVLLSLFFPNGIKMQTTGSVEYPL